MRRIFLLIGLLLCSSLLYANTVNDIIFFGDSLSDNGNLHRYFSFIPKSPPYYDGRFSNGPTWSDDLSASLNNKFGISSDNYAVGGATTVFHNPFDGVLPLKMSAEITDYRVRTFLRDRSQVLFVIWIGANDYMAEKSGSPDGITNDVVNETIANVQTLMNMGGKNFLILDLPDLSKTPRGLTSDTATSQRLHDISIIHHQKLMTQVAKLKQQNPNLFVGFVNVYDLFNDVLADVAQFNQQYNFHLTNSTGSCWTGGYTLQKQTNVDNLTAEITADLMHSNSPDIKKLNPTAVSEYIMRSPSLATAYRVGLLQASGVAPCQNPNDYIFWDEIHPTQITHQIVAKMVEKYLLNQDAGQLVFRK